MNRLDRRIQHRMTPEIVSGLRQAHTELKAYGRDKADMSKKLYEVAGKVADRIGTDVPVHIHTLDYVNASAGTDRIGKGIVSFTYDTKYLMNRPEIEAMMGHELGLCSW